MMGLLLSGFLWSVVIAGSLAAFVAGGNGLTLLLFIIGVIRLVKTGSDVVKWGTP